jgi:uncharacterized protein YdhG (YjbR/CyaY superfamily)
MSAAELNAYVDRLDEPKRSTLRQLRRDILATVPDAEQYIAYAVPGCKVAGKTITGFAAFKDHLSYLPPAARWRPPAPLPTYRSSR